MCDILRDILNVDIKMCDIVTVILKCVIYYVIYYIKMCDIVL